MKYCFNLLNLLSGWGLLTPATEWDMVISELILCILRHRMSSDSAQTVLFLLFSWDPDWKGLSEKIWDNQVFCHSDSQRLWEISFQPSYQTLATCILKSLLINEMQIRFMSACLDSDWIPGRHHKPAHITGVMHHQSGRTCFLKPKICD